MGLAYKWRLDYIDTLTWPTIRGLLEKWSEFPPVDMAVGIFMKGQKNKNTSVLGKDRPNFPVRKVPKGTIGKKE